MLRRFLLLLHQNPRLFSLFSRLRLRLWLDLGCDIFFIDLHVNTLRLVLICRFRAWASNMEAVQTAIVAHKGFDWQNFHSIRTPKESQCAGWMRSQCKADSEVILGTPPSTRPAALCALSAFGVAGGRWFDEYG